MPRKVHVNTTASKMKKMISKKVAQIFGDKQQQQQETGFTIISPD